MDSELATVLRLWRDRLTTERVGLPVNGPRQVPGLRREELAMLAGVSMEYVTRLEQGRAEAPSASVLAALARTLQLDDDEQAHLFTLAGQTARAAEGAKILSMLSESSSSDLTRRVVTTAAELFCLVGTAVGTGLLGTSIEATGQGSLSAQATLVAPAGPAFSIWSVIYLGLFAFTVWQWLPGNAADARLRRLGYLPAVSMVLNAVWILVAQTGLVWLTAVVIVALLAVLAAIGLRLVGTGSGRLAETVVVDGTFGLYLGWVAVATCANLTAALVDLGIEPAVPVATVLGVVVVLVAGGVAAALAWRLGGRVTVALAMAWGLAWVAAGRLTDAPASAPVAVAALVAAAVALGAVAWVRLRRGAGTPARATA